MNRLPENLLIIQAHPDDAEAWSAGTLSLLADRGWRIFIATMTAGGLGGISMNEQETIRVRLAEAGKAGAVIGADYHCFNRRDGFLFDAMDIRIEVVSLMRKVRAGVVITHPPFDYHQDHRTTCRIVDASAMISTLPNVPSDEEPLKFTPLLYHGMPMGFTDPLGGPVPEPHFFVDISGKPMDTKMTMLSQHESQQELMKKMQGMDNFFDEMRKFSAELGSMVNVEYAECYWQHLGGGFQKNPLLQEELSQYIRYRRHNE